MKRRAQERKHNSDWQTSTSLFRTHFNPSLVINHTPALEVFFKGCLEYVLGTPQPTSIFTLGTAMNMPQRGVSDISVHWRHGVNRKRRPVCGRRGGEGLGDVDDHLCNGVKHLLRSLVPLLQWFELGSDSLRMLAEDVPMQCE